MVTPFEDVWVPPLVVENSVDDVGALGGEERDRTPVRFNNQGLMSWTPPLAITTSCQMDIARFPFDTQECGLVIIGWSFPLSEMTIQEGAIMTHVYVPNGEFDLITSYSAHEDVVVADIDSTMKTYRQIVFYFKFRRRWPFYGLNLVMPIVLTSLLMGAVFAVPIESGEKVGFSLTVFLSYIVFLTWVTDNLPPVSNGISVLQVYLAAVLTLSVSATLLTTWVLHLYHTPGHKPIPRIYRKLATAVLKRLYQCRCRAKKTAKNDDFSTNTRVSVAKNQVLPAEKDITILPLSKMDKDEGQYDRSGLYEGLKENDVAGHYETAGHYRMGLYNDAGHYNGRVEKDGMRTGANQKQQSARQEGDDVMSEELTWQDLAIMLDRFSFWVFSTLLFITTLIMIVILYKDY